MQTSSSYEQEIRQHSAKSGHNLQNFIFLSIGIALFALGGFMVSGIYAWQAFDVWLPLTLLIVGLLLLSSKTYSIWLGVVLLVIGVLIWFHSYGLAHFSNLVHIIDWSFVIAGFVLIMTVVLRMSFGFLHRSGPNR